MFLQMFLKVVERFKICVEAFFLRIGDEDNSVGALENEFAAGFVKNLAGNGVKVEAGFESANGAKIERKKIEKQGAIGFGGKRNHLPFLICAGIFVDPLQIGGFSAKAGAVINQLAVNLASGEVDKWHEVSESTLRFITHGCEAANEQARRRFVKRTFGGPDAKWAYLAGLTVNIGSASMHRMSRSKKPAKRRSVRVRASGAQRSKLLKKKPVKKAATRTPPINLVDPLIQAQLKTYEEALRNFQQQKFGKAKELLEKVIIGPSKELAERGLIHLRVTEQRISRTPDSAMRSAEDHYQHGVAMMNHGRWDEAREHLGRARKMAPKADYIVYAMAALDCLTGEAEAAMENLKLAIELKPENRYHARNDEDFAFLQEDPRFTELLYPEREGAGG